ncbi:lysozyme inhibitor LprI family protein [Burkholderia sola]|uniref:lysozyme inhibitor LprI family protein n=1 Tax=Burkholderia TaxID=32008 RepID=UPI001AE2011C|nr:lysozyme inhibitor LprI family protein [Burkholderia sp. AcTa6-5]MBP0714254.1 DUF1311 domain-containing protein [Burkholderia sp. AcTa6-5]
MSRRRIVASVGFILCISLNAQAEVLTDTARIEYRKLTATLEIADDLQPDCPSNEPASCVKAFTDRADARLNLIYQGLLQQLRTQPEVRRALIASERAWITFRDANCRIAAEYYRGIAHGYQIQSCLLRVTKQRVEELRKFARTDSVLSNPGDW